MRCLIFLLFALSFSRASSEVTSSTRRSINIRNPCATTGFLPSLQFHLAQHEHIKSSKITRSADFSGKKYRKRRGHYIQQSNPSEMICCGMRGGGESKEETIIEGNNHESAKENQLQALGISLSLFVTYLTVMGAKCALPSTLPFLTSPNSGLAHPSSSTMTRQDVISRLLAFSTLSIAAGKLALGPIIDSLGGILSLQIALSTLGLCLGSIGLGPQTCPTLTTLSIYWIVIDFAFSSCWAACVKTIRECLDEEGWSKEIGRLAVAARSGNAISFAFFAWLLQWASRVSGGGGATVDSSWRWVFRASSAIQLVPLIMLTYFGRKQNNNIIPSAISVEKTSENSDGTDLGNKFGRSLSMLRKQTQTPEFWLHLVSRSIIMVLVSFLLFIPTYMTQSFELSSASSARVGSIFALGCLSSVSLLAEKAYPSASNIEKPNYKRKAYSMLASLTISTSTLAIHSSFLRNTIFITPGIGSALMFLWGFSLAIPFYLPSSMFALKRGGADGSATIADAFDVVGFGLLAIFNGYVARIAGGGGEAEFKGVLAKQSWLPVFECMTCGSIVASLSLFFAVLLEGRNHGQSTK